MWRDVLWEAFADELEKIAAGAPRPRMPKIKPQAPQVPGYNSAYAMGGVTPPVSPSLPPIPGHSITQPSVTGAPMPLQTHGVGATSAPARMPNMPDPLTQGAQPPMAASGPMMQPTRY